MFGRRTLLALAFVVGLSRAVWAVLPPKEIAQLMADAPAHLQVQVLALRAGHGPVDLCHTTLAVRRIFRDRTGTINLGQVIDLAIYCLRPPLPTEKSLGAMPGAMYWIEQSDLLPGKLLEVYIFRDKDTWSLKLGTLVWPIGVLTSKPLHGQL